MQDPTTDAFRLPADSSKDVLTGILRDGAQKLLATAIEAEVGAYIQEHADSRDAQGHRLVVRNGHKRERAIRTGIGSVTVRPPRVNDRRTDAQGQRLRFTSKILPPYLRKTKSLEASGSRFGRLQSPGCTSRVSAPGTSAKRWRHSWGLRRRG